MICCCWQRAGCTSTPPGKEFRTLTLFCLCFDGLLFSYFFFLFPFCFFFLFFACVHPCSMVSVSNQNEVLSTLARGSKNRTVVATNMNDVSSRSHLILSVYVLARNTITGKDTMGKMHLIDLYELHARAHARACARTGNFRPRETGAGHSREPVSFLYGLASCPALIFLF